MIQHHLITSRVFLEKRTSVTYNKGKGNKQMTSGTVWGVDVYAGFLKRAGVYVFLFISSPLIDSIIEKFPDSLSFK